MALQDFLVSYHSSVRWYFPSAPVVFLSLSPSLAMFTHGTVGEVHEQTDGQKAPAANAATKLGKRQRKKEESFS